MIKVRDLTVVFGRTIALDGITVAIGAGITGLFGPNGSGKSTLLRVLAGLQRPTAGAVTIDGAVARDEAVRRRIGYAGHDPGLYQHLTVRENLVLFGRLYGVEDTRIDTLLAAFDLGGHAGARAGDLSAGLKQRAAAARALVHDPDVLLLDEPYANLDDEAAAAVSQALLDWRREGKCALVATHGAKKVKAFADAGIILRGGRVQVAGTYRRPRKAAAT